MTADNAMEPVQDNSDTGRLLRAFAVVADKLDKHKACHDKGDHLTANDHAETARSISNAVLRMGYGHDS